MSDGLRKNTHGHLLRPVRHEQTSNPDVHRCQFIKGEMWGGWLQGPHADLKHYRPKNGIACHCSAIIDALSAPRQCINNGRDTCLLPDFNGLQWFSQKRLSQIDQHFQLSAWPAVHSLQMNRMGSQSISHLSTPAPHIMITLNQTGEILLQCC